MNFYSEEATSFIILLLGAVTLFTLGFSGLPSLFVSVTSLLAFTYLLWYRKKGLEDPADTMIGFIPGHYLLLLAFSLRGEAAFFIFPLWTVLIFGTLGYDLTYNAGFGGAVGKLTTMSIYCIIWCIIVFLFQRLIIDGLELASGAATATRVGLIVVGVIWIGLGMIRINRRYT
jgi:hypothetical protein